MIITPTSKKQKQDYTARKEAESRLVELEKMKRAGIGDLLAIDRDIVSIRSEFGFRAI